MICPKCKKQITEKTLKCSYCGAKIATLCKKCHAYNPISNLNCVNCNEQLLKVCPECKCVNLPSAAKCRKCGHAFVQPEIAQKEDIIKKIEKSAEISPVIQNVAPEVTQATKDIPQDEVLNTEVETKLEKTVSEPKFDESSSKRAEDTRKKVEEEQSENLVENQQTLNYNAEFYTQQQAKELLNKGICTPEKKIISLNGSKGIGKTLVLKTVIQDLQNQGITWLFGDCSALTQLSPCGFIQDMLLTFFNITNFCADRVQLEKESLKFFRSEFPSLSNEEISNLLNLLYPSKTDYFENILKNKEKTFAFLKKVFDTIISKNQTVLVIENFDLIDGFSYEFLYKLLNSDTINKSFKILLTYSETRPVRGYIYVNGLKSKQYLDISLKAFDKNQMIEIINHYFQGEKCPTEVKSKIFTLSAGNPAILEQTVCLLGEYKFRNNTFDMTFPSSFEAVVKMRLDFLKENPAAYKVLSLAAIQGIKFNPFILSQVVGLAEADFGNVLQLLQQLSYIVQVGEFTYSFINSLLWNEIVEVIKQDPEFQLYNQSLFTVYSNFVISSNSLLAIIAQNLNQDLSAFNIWTDNIKLASYIGDSNLYVISQKQCLILIEKLENVNSSLIRNNIYERLGKLLVKTNPQEAKEYLPNAIANARTLDNPLKEIELTGYLADCCITLGDYYGVIECCDSVVQKLDESLDLEIAMIKSRKLTALLNIGNSGEIVNIIYNEIMPVFDKYINAKPHKNISITTLYKAWLEAYLVLANALIFQGNNRAFLVLSNLIEILQSNNFDNQLFICKTKLAMAFASTVKGDVKGSEDILSEIIKTYETDIMDNEAISRWNLINIINNFIQKKYTGLQEELFQVVTFANNVNDHFTKNILKALLGKLLKDQENAKRAIEIYSEQVTYFAKEKNAIGALLTWYLMSEAELIAEGPDKSLEIAQKALEVAQSSKINNYLFIALYNKVIAEAYMVQAEYDLAKAHIEKAVMVAKKFELHLVLSELYLLYGKYLQDIALVKTDMQVDYVSGAAKMYKKAYEIAQKLQNSYLSTKIENAVVAMNSFCQLNKIVLRDV